MKKSGSIFFDVFSSLDISDTRDLTSYGRTQIDARVGITLQFPWDPHYSSCKEPILTCGRITIFCHESWNDPMDGVDFLLVGGNSAICAVVILKLSLNRPPRLLSGFIELYVRD
ncbi:hypothetical protein N7471_002597 [Penicillium samsonianum]|uniref:uncharacterized protein n=1 Tax=Penicillium samsonianum TaxID=1882272 RepID=UPI002548942D|nr:uncharacterized protein N7471_002597 [Penicillium samsonianum]KAJ6143144.1 hypothetical protein N7471_002597 [Penicillium samsonianum]